MKDFLERDPIPTRKLIIGGLAILLVGLIVILVLFSGSSGIDVDTPIYDDGVLKTTVTYSGEDTRDVWIQYNIFRQDNILSSTKIGDTFTFYETLSKGNTLSSLPIDLTSGEYKIFIYFSTVEDNPKRIAAFIKTIKNTNDDTMIVYDNATVFDPVSCTWTPSSFSVENGKIVSTGDLHSISGEKVVDLNGKRVIPGLIDSHVHIESSLLIPSEFGRLVSSHGVTTVIADPHEIANVAGVDGIDFMMADAKNSITDIFFMVPSCVPATPADIGGAIVSAKDLARYVNHPQVIGLGEMMNYPGAIAGDPEVLEKLALFDIVDGHAPCLTGEDLKKYVSHGITSDHECSTAAEALEKMALGQTIFLREGGAAKNVRALAEIVTPDTISKCAFATDDRNAYSLTSEGSIDNCIRVAVDAGMPLELALSIATLSPAKHYKLNDRGMIAAGYIADFCVLEDGDKFSIAQVFKNGKDVASLSSAAVADKTPTSNSHAFQSPAFNCKIPEKSDLQIPNGKVRVIETIPGQLLTESGVTDSITPDIHKIVCVDRYRAEGFGVGLIKGLNIKRGAIATSISHDAHNIIAVGATDEEIIQAIKALVDAKGGMVVLVDGQTTTFPLPIGGIMTTKSSAEVCSELDKINAALIKTGADKDSFMTMSFMALTVIPHLKITPRGLFDGDAFADVDIRC